MKKRLLRILGIVKLYDFRTLNFGLIFFVTLLSVIGIAVINSASGDASYVRKQIIGLCIGFVVMIVLALVKYEYIIRYYWLMYFVNVGLLLYVLFFGVNHGGAQRWFLLGSIQVQPSELTKLFLLIFFAVLLDRNRQSLNTYRFLLLVFVLAAIPIFLITRQPDLSTSIVIFAMICVIIFVSEIPGNKIKTVFGIGACLALAFLALVFILPKEHNILQEYQYNRLVGFYDSDNKDAADIRYQQENSVLAIASGSLSGKGLNNTSTDSVKNAEFISEPHTDFIFTIIGEELGFIGSIGVILLLGLIVFECFRTGFRAREQIGRSICFGYGTLIAVQSFINIGVVTMIIPNTGLTLPFVSYGLSSLITSFAGIGLVLNIGMRKKMSF